MARTTISGKRSKTVLNYRNVRQRVPQYDDMDVDERESPGSAQVAASGSHEREEPVPAVPVVPEEREDLEGNDQEPEPEPEVEDQPDEQFVRDFLPMG